MADPSPFIAASASSALLATAGPAGAEVAGSRSTGRRGRVAGLARGGLLRYGFAVGAVGVAVALKLLLATWLTRDEPAMLFFAPVILSAAFGGLGPGLLAGALGAVCDEYYFMRPYGTWRLANVQDAVRLAIFAGEAGLVGLVAAQLRAARARANRARRQAGRAAARARRLQLKLLQVGDAERSRLGHDLHDGLGQHLTGIALLARRLQERLTTLAPAEAAEAASVSALARDAVEWTHDLCRSLAPADDTPGDLVVLLDELRVKTARLFRVESALEVSGVPAAASPPVATHLYRIAQEAMTNAVRHGQARRIELGLSFEANALTLRVADDGRGMGQGPPSGQGMGLRIMRYRARMIGGTLEVGGRPGGGTVVVCRCGFPRPAEAADDLA